MSDPVITLGACAENDKPHTPSGTTQMGKAALKTSKCVVHPTRQCATGNSGVD